MTEFLPPYPPSLSRPRRQVSSIGIFKSDSIGILENESYSPKGIDKEIIFFILPKTEKK